MLRSLWLRASLVASHQQQRSVHDRSAVKHGRHQNIVSGAIHKRHVPLQRPLLTILSENISGITALGSIIATLIRRTLTLIYFSISITQLDSDISNKFALKANSLYTRNGLDNSRLSMRHMANGTNINGGLTGYYFRGQRCKYRRVQCRQILNRQMVLLDITSLVVILDGFNSLSVCASKFNVTHLTDNYLIKMRL